MNREEILDLRHNVQKFIRLFGLLEQNVTPCGFNLSPSQVFSLQELEDGILTIGELADRLFLERSTVSRLIDTLVKGGFVNRNLNEENRREVLVSLTDKGRRSLEKVHEQSIQYYRSILDELLEDEQFQVLNGFKLFTNALAKGRGKTNEY
ncbi:MarR family transcriptional regulator [Paenibacillus sedimenti]|uniref:MarR family transcriptional regulator n=1 Tax=Paenibacillus sedimenti TaxID=2770274 RepID=A0A926KVV8_9BACL|nr:MarR family transcriptional regulator [Paenibacillus sedimenti]MBD0383841.1 MarR family transcriptional regulator [Paenibacillus sedimenti]